MHTYWLTGIYSAEDNIVMDTSEFPAHLKPHGPVFTDEPTGPVIIDESKLTKLDEDGWSEGKVSAVDSGIGYDDKCDAIYAHSLRRRSSVEIEIESDKASDKVITFDEDEQF